MQLAARRVGGVVVSQVTRVGTWAKNWRRYREKLSRRMEENDGR